MKILCAVLLICAVSALKAPPVFPLDWTSVEQDFLIVYQGTYVQQGDLYCCGDDNCEIQTEYMSGHNYFDYSHNRTRFDDPVQGSIVNFFYPQYKEMAVDGTNTCTSYCPLDYDLTPYAIDPNATDIGPSKVGNVTAEQWQWKETIFGIFVVQINNIYVSSAGLPILEVDELTPFGQNLGEETTTYLSFAAGTPDPSHFDIKNVDSCPLDPNCDDDLRQHVRLRSHSPKAVLRHFQDKQNKNQRSVRPPLPRHHRRPQH